MKRHFQIEKIIMSPISTHSNAITSNSVGLAPNSNKKFQLFMRLYTRNIFHDVINNTRIVDMVTFTGTVGFWFNLALIMISFRESLWSWNILHQNFLTIFWGIRNRQ